MNHEASFKRGNLLVLLLLALAAAILYLPKVSDNIGWYNSGEFVAAAITADVPHVPGYPLFSRMNEAFLKLPIASGAAFKLNLLSVLVALAAAMAMFVLLILAGLESLPAAVAVILLLASHTYFAQAVLVEVYCLEILFIVAGLIIGLLLERGSNSKFLAFAAGLVGALGVGHRPTFVLYALALIFFVKSRNRSLKEMSLTWFLMGLGLGLLPSVDLYFRLQNPQRLLLDPMIGRGFTGFLRVYTATVYSGGLFSLAPIEVWHRFLFFIKFILTDSSLLVLPLALLALFRRDDGKAIKKALLFIAMINLIFVLNYNAFEAHSMLLPCIFCLSALSGFVFNAVKQRQLRNLICLTVMVSAGLGAWVSQSPVDDAAIAYSQRAFKEVPPGAVVLMSNDVEFRPYYYLRLSRNFRSDVAVQLVDAYSGAELAQLAKIVGRRPVVGSLIHPPDSLKTLVASFSLNCEGYSCKIVPPGHPLIDQVEPANAVTFGKSRVAINFESPDAIIAGMPLVYRVEFSGSRSDFADLRVWSFLTDDKGRVLSRNGVLVGQDCHYPFAWVHKSCLAQDRVNIGLKRALVVPHDLEPGTYRFAVYFEQSSRMVEMPSLREQIQGINLFNLDGFLEVFRLDYGLSQRLPVTVKAAQALLDKLPGNFVAAWSQPGRLEIVESPDLNL